MPSDLDSSTPSVTSALPDLSESERSHGTSLEGHSWAEEVRRGQRGWGAGSQSLGLSPKEGHTLLSSSGLDAPSPEQ